MEMVASRAFQGELSLSYSEASGAGLVASSGWGAMGRIGPWSPVIGVLSLVLACGAYNLSLLSDSAAVRTRNHHHSSNLLLPPSRLLYTRRYC